MPESVSEFDLAPESRRHLSSLNKENAKRVARHLVYAGEMMEIDPELAYLHAQAAYQRAARIDIVREALGLAAYVTGRYSQALRELRTYRRMTDDYEHVAIEADSERGLGRPEKALTFIAGIPLKKLDLAAQIELVIVTSGARADTGDYEGGLEVLEKVQSQNLTDELRARIELVKADRLAELGRHEEAEQLRERWEPVFSGDPVDVLADEEGSDQGDDMTPSAEPTSESSDESPADDSSEEATAEDPSASDGESSGLASDAGSEPSDADGDTPEDQPHSVVQPQSLQPQMSDEEARENSEKESEDLEGAGSDQGADQEDV
ncbi:MAG: hypothetical protein SPI12_05260 [Actinomycetaceae bacterium]|nr:hypothetical protein [Actinomycetaceae bacterium]MDY6083252.1 hypothetical protein [Actinomycetaceae bacterium]